MIIWVVCWQELLAAQLVSGLAKRVLTLLGRIFALINPVIGAYICREKVLS